MYEKQNFVDGQKLRAYQLNHMEEGIAEASNGFVALEQTATSEADGGENIITATRADGSTNTIVIRNGRTGATGPVGPKGDKGDPGSGASSWNDLTDKPFGESYGDTLTWDGNTEGLVEVNLGMPGMLHYKVSDAVLSAADVSAESVSSIALSNGQTYSFTAADIIFDGGIGMHSAFYFVSVDTSAAAMVGCETGTYLMKTPGGEAYVSSITIPGYTGFPMTKTIDPKYLPMDEIIAAVRAAMG